MATTEKDTALLPVYLFDGEDLLKRETVLKRLKARVARGGDISFDYDVFFGEAATGSAIVAACNTLPFASEARLVQVTDADKLKKADADALADYLGAPAATAVLVLLADKLPQNTRLYKAVRSFGEKAVISCLPQKRYDLARTVRSLGPRYGVKITEGAAQALIDRVGENTVYLDNEIKKLALAHQGSDAVSEQEVHSMVSRTAEIKPWELVDAFSGRDITRCLVCLNRMPSTSPHALLAMCVTRLRELICAKSLSERGRAADLPTVLKMPGWRVKNHARWAEGYSRQELRDALVSARDLERAMKSGADPDDAFLEWLLACMRRDTAGD